MKVKHTEYMKQLVGILLGLIVLVTAVSCLDEETVAQEGQLVTVTLSPASGAPGTRSLDADNPPQPNPDLDAADRRITQFPILVFSTTGGLVENFYTTDIATRNPWTIRLYGGTYHFVFIANEGSAGDNSGTDQQWNTLKTFTGSLTQLENIAFPSSAFADTKDIPMSAICKDVQLLGDNQYKIGGGGTQTGTWPVTVTRLGVRVDVRLHTALAQKVQDFTGLEFHNVPTSVPVLEQTTGGTPTDLLSPAGYESSPFRPVLKANGDTPDFTDIGTGPQAGEKEWKKTRVILPSSVFADNTDPDKGIEVHVIYGGTSAKAVLAPDPATSYTQPRNTYYTFDAELVNSGAQPQLFITAQSWASGSVTVNMGEQWLNVKQLTATVTGSNTARIHFWSNQPDALIAVDANCKKVTADDTVVNNLFDNLSGTGAANRHYSSTTGAGFIDILTKSSVTAAANGDYTIYLNAGGLRQEITVTIAIP
jgi:hypothetical protein